MMSIPSFHDLARHHTRCRSVCLSPPCSLRYGWKHWWLGEAQARRRVGLAEDTELAVIVIFRNPIAWLLAMYAEPHHAPHPPSVRSFNDFVRRAPFESWDLLRSSSAASSGGVGDDGSDRHLRLLSATNHSQPQRQQQQHREGGGAMHPSQQQHRQGGAGINPFVWPMPPGATRVESAAGGILALRSEKIRQMLALGTALNGTAARRSGGGHERFAAIRYEDLQVTHISRQWPFVAVVDRVTQSPPVGRHGE